MITCIRCRGRLDADGHQPACPVLEHDVAALLAAKPLQLRPEDR